ncbi:MAG: type IV pilus biogenesis/stability protein PilW [Pseudomonadota bacterium]
MNKIAFLLMLGVLTGCVSTTSGPPKPTPDKEDAAEFNYQLGARYYRNGSYDLARDRLKQSLEFDDRRAITWYTLALTYEQLENPRLARESYEQAVRVDPGNYDAQNAYAVFNCRQGDFDYAARYFDRASRNEKNDRAWVTLTNAGVCMVQKPDVARAESYFRSALELRPTYGEALLQLAVLKHQNADYLGARAFMERFLSQNAPSAGVLFLAVQIEAELGDNTARRQYETRLIREFPESAEARRVLESS